MRDLCPFGQVIVSLITAMSNPEEVVPKAVVIVFPIYPGVTQLDFTGPHQLLARAPGVELLVASIGGASVNAEGLIFSSLARLENIERCDVLCVPGGRGCTDAIQNVPYITAIRRLAAGARYLTSVCTGSLILGAAGLLQGRRAACHWAWRDFLPLFGAIPEPGRVVRDGNILTGGGVTAGIDFALTLMAELSGPVVAQSIQLALEYAPEPPFDSGRPDTAPRGILARVQNLNAAAMPQRSAALVRAAAHYRQLGMVAVPKAHNHRKPQMELTESEKNFVEFTTGAPARRQDARTHQ
jgi:cyclohexyl-isocyanide hydratase